MARSKTTLAVTSLSILVSGCGYHVPSKHLFRADKPYIDPTNQEMFQNTEGRAEANIIGNLRCEIENGIYLASAIRHEGRNNTAYLRDSWGTLVTLKLTWDEQSSFSPGLSLIHPMSNSQSRTFGFGGSTSAHATRVETVTFLYENRALWDDEAKWVQNSTANPKGLMSDCTRRETGTMIDSNLKISEFIVDKATVASTGIASTDEPNNAPFSTFQEELTFVGTYSANFTPTWKLTKLSANSNSDLVAGTRTVTGNVIVTLGPLLETEDKKSYQHKLGDLPAALHTAAVIGGATASSISSQNH